MQPSLPHSSCVLDASCCPRPLPLPATSVRRRRPLASLSGSNSAGFCHRPPSRPTRHGLSPAPKPCRRCCVVDLIPRSSSSMHSSSRDIYISISIFHTNVHPYSFPVCTHRHLRTLAQEYIPSYQAEKTREKKFVSSVLGHCVSNVATPYISVCPSINISTLLIYVYCAVYGVWRMAA